MIVLQAYVYKRNGYAWKIDLSKLEKLVVIDIELVPVSAVQVVENYKDEKKPTPIEKKEVNHKEITQVSVVREVENYKDKRPNQQDEYDNYDDFEE